MSNRTLLDPSRKSENAKAFQAFLESRVVGQERAVRRLVQAYETSLSQLREDDKPILFALYPGPSGTGKTFLAKCLAEFFFGNPNSFTKIPCKDFRSGHEISALVGASAGYLGYCDPEKSHGRSLPRLSQERIDRFANAQASLILQMDKSALELQARILFLEEEYRKKYESLKNKKNGLTELTAAHAEIVDLRNQMEAKRAKVLIKTGGKLFSVILFDEVEKAHPALHNFLLDVADEGETVLMNGEKTSLVNSFVIVTSNAGSKQMAKVAAGGTGSIGFGAKETRSDGGAIYAEVVDELKKIFPTELLGRISDDIVIFHPLKEQELLEIADRQIDQINMDLELRMGAVLKTSPDVRQAIVAEALEHPEYGARPIVKKVKKLLRDPLVNLSASNQLFQGDTVYAELENGRIVFQREGPAQFLEASEIGESLG